MLDRVCGRDVQAERSAYKGSRNTRKNCLPHEVRELGVCQPSLNTALGVGGPGCSFLCTCTCLKQEPSSFPVHKANLQTNDASTGHWQASAMKTERSGVCMGHWQHCLHCLLQNNSNPINSCLHCWYLVSPFSLFYLLSNRAYLSLSSHLFLSYKMYNFSLPISPLSSTLYSP